MKNRQLMFIPEINPNTFLFFYFKGNTGRSYSFREYPEIGGTIVKKSESFGYTVSEILKMAKYTFDAPTHSTSDEEFWRKEIEKYNRRYCHEMTPGKGWLKAPVKVRKDRSVPKSTQLAPRGPFMIYNKHGVAINSIEDWRIHASPKKGDFHWKDGRSAKELAKAWFDSGKLKFPKDLRTILNSHPITAKFVPEKAWAEYVTKFDNFKGEGRNHDMVLIGISGHRKVLISIEAKADESFGNEIQDMRSSNPRTNIYKRRDLLSSAIFGRKYDSGLGILRYQLMTAVAGTLVEARKQKADFAVFIAHEFISKSLDRMKIETNVFDFEMFFRAVARDTALCLPKDKLVEIGTVPGGVFIPGDIPLLVGKVSTRLYY